MKQNAWIKDIVSKKQPDIVFCGHGIFQSKNCFNGGNFNNKHEAPNIKVWAVVLTVYIGKQLNVPRIGG